MEDATEELENLVVLLGGMRHEDYLRQLISAAAAAASRVLLCTGTQHAADAEEVATAAAGPAAVHTQATEEEDGVAAAAHPEAVTQVHSSAHAGGASATPAPAPAPPNQPTPTPKPPLYKQKNAIEPKHTGAPLFTAAPPPPTPYTPHNQQRPAPQPFQRPQRVAVGQHVRAKFKNSPDHYDGVVLSINYHCGGVLLHSFRIIFADGQVDQAVPPANIIAPAHAAAPPLPESAPQAQTVSFKERMPLLQSASSHADSSNSGQTLDSPSLDTFVAPESSTPPPLLAAPVAVNNCRSSSASASSSSVSSATSVALDIFNMLKKKTAKKKK